MNIDKKRKSKNGNVFKQKLKKKKAEGPKFPKIENPQYEISKALVMYKFNESECQQAPKFTEANFLAEFLWPMTIPEFLTNVYRKKAYSTVNKDASNSLLRRCSKLIKDHVFDLDLNEMMENTASENIHIWMREKVNPDEDRVGQIESFEIDNGNVNSAKICYNSGASLYFRSSQEMADIFVRQVSEALGMNFGAYYPTGEPGAEGAVKGEIETFVSRKDHVTDWHFDFMENFTIQLRGSKTWKLLPITSTHPIRGCTPHYKNIDTVEQQVKVHKLHDPKFQFVPESFDGYNEVTLTEGSILYHPAGIWHRVECSEDSISINISLITNSWADVISESIHHLLWTKEETREGIIIKDIPSARTHLKLLLEKTKNWISELKPEDILPNTLFTPRTPIIELNDANYNKDLNINNSTVFEYNPLAVLVEVPENKNHTHDEEEDEHVYVAPEGHKRFALHINFGNESLDSSVRTEIVVPEEIVSVVNFVSVQRSPFSFQKLTDDLKKEGLLTIEKDKIIHLLRTLCYCGFIRTK